MRAWLFRSSVVVRLVLEEGRSSVTRFALGFFIVCMSGVVVAKLLIIGRMLGIL
jgi:hypothetical protein